MSSHRKASILTLFLWVTLIALMPIFFVYLHRGTHRDQAQAHTHITHDLVQG